VFVAHKANINTLSRYLLFCKRLGIDAVESTDSSVLLRTRRLNALYERDADIAEVDAIFQHARHVAEQLGICLQLPTLRKKQLGCEWARAFNIDYSGSISPCPLLSNQYGYYFGKERVESSGISFGNIDKQPPFDIWLSPTFRDFRAYLLAGHLPLACSRCPEGTE